MNKFAFQGTRVVRVCQRIQEQLFELFVWPDGIVTDLFGRVYCYVEPYWEPMLQPFSGFRPMGGVEIVRYGDPGVGLVWHKKGEMLLRPLFPSVDGLDHTLSVEQSPSEIGLSPAELLPIYDRSGQSHELRFITVLSAEYHCNWMFVTADPGPRVGDLLFVLGEKTVVSYEIVGVSEFCVSFSVGPGDRSVVSLERSKIESTGDDDGVFQTMAVLSQWLCAPIVEQKEV